MRVYCYFTISHNISLWTLCEVTFVINWPRAKSNEDVTVYWNVKWLKNVEYSFNKIWHFLMKSWLTCYDTLPWLNNERSKINLPAKQLTSNDLRLDSFTALTNTLSRDWKASSSRISLWAFTSDSARSNLPYWQSAIHSPSNHPCLLLPTRIESRWSAALIRFLSSIKLLISSSSSSDTNELRWSMNGVSRTFFRKGLWFLLTIARAIRSSAGIALDKTNRTNK